MVSKLVTTIARKVGGKALEKSAEKLSDTYDYVSDRVRWGIKPLNMGEEESLNCYKYMPQDKTGFCDSVGNSKREQYHHPWRSKK